MCKKITWRKFHKWGGLIMAVFVIVFCLSGIVLNHRQFFSNYNVSRSILPPSYHFEKYNNGSIKGTLPLTDDSILTYGNTGIWVTDRGFNEFRDFNDGFPTGIDHRNIKNMVRLKDKSLWCAGQYGVYHHDGQSWKPVSLNDNKERISDITTASDSSTLVILTRSEVFTLDPTTCQVVSHTVSAPDGKKAKTTLFKTFWMIHSGELFGIVGRIIVDVVAIIIVVLSLTGIVLFFIPYRSKWRKRHKLEPSSKKILQFFKWNNIIHNKVGYATALFTIIIAFTGMCLRPPLMIPLVLTKTSPIPGSAQDSDNYWHDKMRGIRWDSSHQKWLLSTSEGFLYLDKDFNEDPIPIIDGTLPPISPMGITVFENISADKWLIGSFSGLYIWDTSKGTVKDYFTGKDHDPNQRTYSIGNSLVSGASRDLVYEDLIVFDYSKGAESLPEMSGRLKSQPMSLWNAALELHVGRCYAPLMGPFSELFVFTFGLLLTLVLVSGVIIHVRQKRKRLPKSCDNNEK